MIEPKPIGTHLIADLHGCTGLGDPVLVEAAMRAAVAAAGATLLEIRLHHFGPEMGVTGVALLAESHLSIHTWPEHGYAAVDIFLCGTGEHLEPALDAMRVRFGCREVRVQTVRRG